LADVVRLADLPELTESIHVATAPERIWPYVSDIAFGVETSAELLAVEWCDGEGPAPFVGRSFVGTNANRYFGQWQTTSTVTECDEPRVFGWAVGDVDRPNSRWRFTLEPDDDGTTLTQWVRIGPGDSGLTIAVARMPDKEERIVASRLREFAAAMRAHLEAVKARAEAS
jgi:hypothetical protein